MDASRFDTLSRKLTTGLTRRTALRGLGGGFAATGLAGLGLSRANAQDSTPVASPAASDASDRTFFLFVQTFSSGTLQPHATEADTYSLTLTGGAAETIYFSDRPERIVGTVPTVQFLDSLGFSPNNPPNAALVAQTDAGEDIVVVELLNPVYSEGFGPNGAVTLTYDVRILADYQEDGLAHLAARQDDAALPESFGTASLFIDDCPDLGGCEIYVGRGPQYVGPIPSGINIGQCWSWSGVICKPCNGWSAQQYADACNSAYPDQCNGRCAVELG